jgi:hypothetical protein
MTSPLPSLPEMASGPAGFTPVGGKGGALGVGAGEGGDADADAGFRPTPVHGADSFGYALRHGSADSRGLPASGGADSLPPSLQVTPLRDYSPLRTHSALGGVSHTPDGGLSIDSNLSVGAALDSARACTAAADKQAGGQPLRPAPTKVAGTTGGAGGAGGFGGSTQPGGPAAQQQA